MATENVVLLAFAASLGMLHLIGGPLSGLFREPHKRRTSSFVVPPIPPPPSTLLPPLLGGGQPAPSEAPRDPDAERSSSEVIA